ncbi:MAG: tryptophan-rich sensory protein [Candidatus Liptonbacteria bacterium]|nr:tryptophan-rich sensory protein [Candidatus Liptonbacteria bacterium]
MSTVFKLVAAVAISELAGVVGMIFTAPAISSGPSASSGQGWYAMLEKPALSPPNWVFGPVWTTLFALMGIALFLVWRKHSHILENVRMLHAWRLAMFAFAFQLSLNVFWSMMFFGLQSPAGAFAVVVSLWLAILASILAFWKISPPAAWLLVPYILWVSFAGYLNYAIWMLN